jgi:hypothetical protein
MDVFKKSDGRRSFIFPGFRTIWMLEIFDKMRHKDLQFSFGRKITRVVLWESQGGHSGTHQNNNVEFYEIYSSSSLTIQITQSALSFGPDPDPFHRTELSSLINKNPDRELRDSDKR